MKICCDFCKGLMLTLGLILSMGSLQAQSPANCDLSKCSPEKRAECAKKCAAMASTNVLNALFAAPTAQTASLKSAKCNPAACKKAKTTEAKLVSTNVTEAPNYTNSGETKETSTKLAKKKCCATKAKCTKTKTSSL